MERGPIKWSREKLHSAKESIKSHKIRSGAALASIAGAVTIYETGEAVPAAIFLAGGGIGAKIDNAITRRQAPIRDHQVFDGDYQILVRGNRHLAAVRGIVDVMWAAGAAGSAFISLRNGLSVDVPLYFAGNLAGSVLEPVRRAVNGVRTIYNNRMNSDL